VAERLPVLRLDVTVESGDADGAHENLTDELKDAILSSNVAELYRIDVAALAGTVDAD
jgi:hypothetical protein